MTKKIYKGLSKLYKQCNKCQGTGKLKRRQAYLDTPDVKKMLALMKRNKLNQLSLAKVLDLSQGTVNGWMHPHTNAQGKIKKIYFQLLGAKGYK